MEEFHMARFNMFDSSMFIPCFSLPHPTNWDDHHLSFLDDTNFDDMILQEFQSKPYFDHQAEEHSNGVVNIQGSESSSSWYPSSSSSLLTCMLESDRVCSLSSSEVRHGVNLPLSSTDHPLMGSDHEPINQQLSERKHGMRINKAKATKAKCGQTSCSSGKKTSLEASAKKPRIEMPSPLPSFNVRKDKLQDRITALQQLVSPFGKTDTASVLQQATEYIKLLHAEVKALSDPSLGSDNQIQYHKESVNGEEIGSRGLCLVPISSTFPVAVASCSDFWSTMF